jgi:hypothetical protein
MTDLISRTEDIKPELIPSLYVETTRDKVIVEALKSPTAIILEGSRGTGKSFLLRVAEAQLSEAFQNDKVLPIYVSFTKSSLLQSGDKNQFIHWMMARLCTCILRACYKRGLLVQPHGAQILLAGGKVDPSDAESPLERVAQTYEQTYRRPGEQVDAGVVPSVDNFKDAIDDLCRDKGIERICVFFDEAAHVFRPEQQRQFFTFYRDLRSPFLNCKAAVYPGVTFYGETFQSTHDTTIMTLNRNPLDSDYLAGMREFVLKQANAQLADDIEKNRENFHALAYAVHGNPRLLLKTVSKSGRLKSAEVSRTLKEFYRTEIWAEHTGLGEKYGGHRAFVDWGREFIDKAVIPDSIAKNDQWANEGKTESTCYFWIHRDAPTAINEALRLLSYTGIVTRIDSGVVATRSHIGTRYAVNLGCLSAPSADPISTLTHFGRTLNVKRFTEYGANHTFFGNLAAAVGDFKEMDISEVLGEWLAKPIEVVDLTDYQKSGLKSMGLNSVGKALQASETEFQRIDYIGPKRSRNIMNIVMASILEYLSG